MMPISDFQFAFCGLATVAATLGYACARRAARSLASQNTEPSKADVEAGPSEERSLKRKLDHSEEHDVDAEEHSRPMKRNRTPPSDKHELDEDFNQEWEVVVAPPPYEEAAALPHTEAPVQDHSTPPKGDPPSFEDVTPAREPTPQADPGVSRPVDKGVEARRCSTPQPQVALSPSEPENPPPKPFVPSKSKPINPFSAFSGSSSPFTACSNTTSSFALSGEDIKNIPAWRRTGTAVFSQASSANALALSPNDVLPPNDTSSEVLVKASSCLTGEENEIIDAELKGVKLFIKRGRKEFTDGIYGHVKILTQKSLSEGTVNEDQAESNSRVRLLFRRDPLGQVSMNVGLRPAVRCHFDAAENILRLVLMETVATDGETPKEDVVVYAFKPGRAQKADFQSFAKVLCDHQGLKSRPATSVNSDAAAS